MKILWRIAGYGSVIFLFAGIAIEVSSLACSVACLGGILGSITVIEDFIKLFESI